MASCGGGTGRGLKTFHLGNCKNTPKPSNQKENFGHILVIFTGAAPTAMDTYKYFLSLDIVLQDAYGMSETSGPHHLLHPGTAQFMGSVGRTIPGTKTKLKNQDEDGNGEVAMYGRNIMMGYLNREDKTAEDIDSEGYMCSGDLGSMNKEGYLYITGTVVSLRS